MKPFEWNDEKNKLLKRTRGISFEEIVESFKLGNTIKVTDHPNKIKYNNQKIMFIKINNYIYMVPMVIDTDHIFLKTIIPSKKYTKLLLINKYNEKTKIR